ncbi:MAG: hypothetical protein P1U63_07210 [Coxiellaceae bacterium]|nr:hypothetical protein [Coxiellaceae bacterium]
MPIELLEHEKELTKTITPKLMATLLLSIIEDNKEIAKRLTKKPKRTHFDAPTIPTMCIFCYITRIHKYGVGNKLNSAYSLIIMLIYLDRHIAMNKTLITHHNAHHLIATAFLLAQKQYFDDIYDNKYYAGLFGIPLRKLNSLEIQFLYEISFSLHVRERIFKKYKEELFKRHQTNEMSFSLK